MSDEETTEALRMSFWYGSRSNLDFKYFKDLTDSEFGNFVEELLGALTMTMNDGDAYRLIDVTHRWQQHAYAGHLGDPSAFPHAHDDTPLAQLGKPLAEAKIALLTSSGHFLEGDDPQPFGVENMTQAEAEQRIAEFLGAPPSLSEIPIDTPSEQLRVRHGGYPVSAVAQDSSSGFAAWPFARAGRPGRDRRGRAHGVLVRWGNVAATPQEGGGATVG